nr:hypothetical protein [Tanacetum cinerariifolium]
MSLLIKFRPAVRQTQFVVTESEPEEAPSEVEELQSLGFRVPFMGEEFEASKPSSTRTISSHSSTSSNSATSLSTNHPLTHASPTPIPTRDLFHRKTARMTERAHPVMSPGHSARVAEAMALSDSTLSKRYISYYKTPLPSMTLRDEGPRLEGKEVEVVPEGQQQAVPVMDIATDRPLRLGYGALRRHEVALGEDQGSSTLEVGQSSRSVPEQQGAERTPPSPEWSSSSLPLSSSSLRLDALPPTLFTDINRDVRELYTSLGVVRYEIFLQRPMLALEAWAYMSWAGYDDHRLIHDMLVQHDAMHFEL